MAAPLLIDIPHRIGREEARRRLKARIGELPAHIPGGIAEVRSSWPGEDQMIVDVSALGQDVSTSIEIEERLVRVRLLLPPLLSMFAGAIEAGVRAKGGKLLLGDESDASG
jgi:hypothetical protein